MLSQRSKRAYRQVQLVQRLIQRWQSPHMSPCHQLFPFFISLPILLVLVTSLLNKPSKLLQVSYHFISCTLECNFWTPYLLSLLYSKGFIYSSMHAPWVLQGYFPAYLHPFSRLRSRHTLESLQFLTLPQIYSIEGAASSPLPPNTTDKFLSFHPLSCSERPSQCWVDTPSNCFLIRIKSEI